MWGNIGVWGYVSLEEVYVDIYVLYIHICIYTSVYLHVYGEVS